MSISLVPDGISDGGAVRLLVSNGSVAVAENQAIGAGKLYHWPVTGYLPRAWGGVMPSAYASITVSAPSQNGSVSWYSTDDAGSPNGTLIQVHGDASHMRELWSGFVHCCRNSYTKINGISTYASTSLTSNSTNAGPYTFSWTGLQHHGSSYPLTLKFFSFTN